MTQSNDLMEFLPPGIYPRFDWFDVIFNDCTLRHVFKHFDFDSNSYDSELDFLDLQSQFIGGLATFNVPLINGCRLFIKRFYLDMANCYRFEDLLDLVLPEIKISFGGVALSQFGYDWMLHYVRKPLPFFAHMTRLDFAFDFINYKPESLPALHDFLMDPANLSDSDRVCCFGVNGGYSYRCVWGSDDHRVYFGSVKSSRMLRIYDKKLENTRQGVFKCPEHLIQFENATSWIRMELQLRDHECERWLYGSDSENKTPSDIELFEGVFRKIFEKYALRDMSGRSPLGMPEFWRTFVDFSDLPVYILNLTLAQKLDATGKINNAGQRSALGALLYMARYGVKAWDDLILNLLYELNQSEDEISRRKRLAALRTLSQSAGNSLETYRKSGAILGDKFNPHYFIR